MLRGLGRSPFGPRAPFGPGPGGNNGDAASSAPEQAGPGTPFPGGIPSAPRRGSASGPRRRGGARRPRRSIRRSRRTRP